MSRFLQAGGSAMAFACALAAHPVAAQAPAQSPADTPATSGVVALPTIAVDAAEATSVGSLTVPSVAEQRRRLEQIPGSVEFVDAKSFENRFSNTLRDVLKDTPGVFVQQRYGQEIRLSIRGSGLGRSYHLRGIEVLQDGIPVNLADGSGDFYQIDPLSARSIEVYKGGNGLIFGSSTLGGAINVVTPTAYTAVGSNIVRLEAGSYGTIRASAQTSRVEGDADVLVNATESHSDGFRLHSNQDYQQVNANLGYRIAPGIETRFYLGTYVTRQKLPGTLSLFDALHNPTFTTAASLSGNQSREVYAERLANRTSFALDVGQLDIDSWLIHKRLYHPIFQVIDQDGMTYGVAPHYTARFDLFGFGNDLVVGGRAFGGTNTALQYVNAAGHEGARTFDGRQNAYNYEAFVDNKVWFTPELALMTGVKLFHDERDFRNFTAIPFTAANRSYDGFNPKLGLLWQPVQDIQVFTDVTRSHDVPDFSDLTQTNLNGTSFVPLEAQKAWTFEIGSRGSYDRLKWDVTYYRSAIRDELLTFNTNAAVGVPATTFNADGTLHQGIELGAAIDLVRDVSGEGAGDTITLAQVWTHNDFRFVRDRVYGDNQIAGVPRDVLRTTLSYTRPDGLYVAPAIDWVPQGAFADHANTLKVPGYTLFGVQTGWNFSNGLSVFVDARNLADRRFVSDISVVADARTASTAIFYPGDGRSVFAGLRYTW